MVTSYQQTKGKKEMSENTYYEIKGKIDGEIEILFGSFVKSDCTYELDAERDGWKEQGYTALKISTRATADDPDMEVYTVAELASNDDQDDQDDDIQTYETGRQYDAPQVLKYKTISAELDTDFNLYDLVVYMVDDSRNLAYELKIYMSRREAADGESVLRAYDAGNNRILCYGELKAENLI